MSEHAKTLDVLAQIRRNIPSQGFVLFWAAVPVVAVVVALNLMVWLR